MAKISKILLVYSTLAALIATTTATHSATPMEQVQEALVDWLRHNVVGMPLSDSRPVYEFETPQKMTEIYYGLGYNGDMKVMGIEQDGKIILRQDFDPDQHQEILLHELFHFFVEASGRRRGYFPCTAAEEQVAYAVQNKYVTEVKLGKGIIAGEQFADRTCLQPQIAGAPAIPATQVQRDER